MAIRRCPYCKAIIDESQKYCNNCGTQLLFPEDELVEEPIKGEKVTDEDFKDSSEEEFEKSLEEPAEEEAEEEKEEIDLEEILEGGAPFPDEQKDEKEEPEKEEEPEKKEEPEKEEEKEIEAVAAEPEPEPAPEPEPEVEPEPEIEYLAEEQVEEEKEKEKEKEKTPEFIEKKVAEAVEAPTVEDDEDVEEVEEPGEEIKDKDEDLEMETAETKEESDTREEISRLLEALEKKHRNAVLTKDEEKIIAPLEDQADAPSWADQGKETGSVEFTAEEEAADKLDEKSFAAGDTVDFEEEVMQRAERMSEKRPTIGIPETVTKIEDFEVSGVKDTGEVSADEEPFSAVAPRSRLGFFGRVKAFVFDVIFIAFLWLVAVVPASRMMMTGVRSLVKVAAVPLGLLFVVLLSGYFFLFFFFLGETLGGRLVTPRR